MNIKLKILLAIPLFLLPINSLLAIEKIWVAIIDNYVEYQSSISKKTLNQIITGQYKNEYLHLENVYWFNDESNNEELQNNAEPQSKAGKVWGYKNDTYLRVSNILRIIPLSEEHIKKYYEPR